MADSAPTPPPSDSEFATPESLDAKVRELETSSPKAKQRQGLGRRLLLGAAGLAATGAAVAWKFGPERPHEAAPNGSSRKLKDHRVVLATGKPRLVVARGPSPSRNAEAALERMGGMGALVKKGEVVLIKPNIGWDRIPAQAANTDPELVAALVRLCRDAGAKEVYVTDVSCNEARRSFAKSGIEVAARKAGAKVLLPEDAPKFAVSGPGKLGIWEIPEPFFLADRIINVPIAKHHGLTQLTCAMKNWLGALHGARRPLHPRINEALAELEQLIKPTIHVVDASRVLMRNGPTGGNLADVKEMNALAVSVDPVAVDAWAADLLGFNQGQIGYLAVAEKQGLGSTQWKRLSPPELTVG